ncbi:hypothetical protein OA955_01250 [Candidatus Marinimicrobia bacterium]|nr:hypothetical protein [Candidatus Neomarinimicrobiota bacterium]
MQKILFVCTANIFRSRFSEEVYNYLANNLNLSSRAFSAGLMVGHYKTRTIYGPALEHLKLLNIVPERKDELSTHIDDLNLKQFDKIICLDKNEHQPMVRKNKNLSNYTIEYWNIVDEPLVSRNISLPQCYKKVEKLVDQHFLELTS